MTTLISGEQAEQLRDEFVPRFSSPEAYASSVRKCFDKLGPKTTAASLRRWLTEDLDVDSVMAQALPTREPVLPLRSSYDLSDCRHCGGLRYVRAAGLPIGHPDFGRAIPCEFCEDSDHKKSCVLCKKPRVLSGYFGPETPTVPADWEPGKSIPDDWRPVR